MTKDDIIRMAREAGFERLGTYASFGEDWVAFTESLEAFAHLVAAAEREAIAQMFEGAPALVQFAQNDKGGCLICGFTPKIAIEAIRARGIGHD